MALCDVAKDSVRLIGSALGTRGFILILITVEYKTTDALSSKMIISDF